MTMQAKSCGCVYFRRVFVGVVGHVLSREPEGEACGRDEGPVAVVDDSLAEEPAFLVLRPCHAPLSAP